jgi:hypothetical protein
VLLLAAWAAGWGCASEEIPKYGDPSQVIGGGGDGGGGSTSTGTTCQADPACAVSFATDIFPVLNGQAQCAGGGLCHGNGGGGITMTADAASFFQVLTTLQMATGKYVVPCDPASSQILCNLQVSDGPANPDACGAVMPVAAADGPTTAQLKDIEDWIACGAPDN